MWVQLKSVQYIEVAGKLATYHPGDWVNVGRQQAELWVRSGLACVPSENGSEQAMIAGNAGAIIVVAETDKFERAERVLEPYKERLKILEGAPLPIFKRTMIWETSLKFRRELVPVGLNLLDKWQIAIPLCNYNTLACHIGDEEEREQTKAVIRDLRVPLYETRLMFVRQCPEIEKLLKLWQTDVKDGCNERLSFLRALYVTKPYILALPTVWWDNNAPR